MSKNQFIEVLVSSEALWSPPHHLDPMDPKWEEAWSTASERQKQNLARGWVWSALTFETFLDVFDKKLDFTQKLQPYLDSPFFLPHIEEEQWAYFTCFLGYETKLVENKLSTGNLAEARLLSRLFFGDNHQQRKALLVLPTVDEKTCYGCYNAASTQAWRIAEHGSDDFIAAALYVSYTSGMNGEVPSQELPLLARVAQAIGSYGAYGVRQPNPLEKAFPFGTLKSEVQKMSPKTAAQLLSLIIENAVVNYDGDAYISSTSFLIHELGTTEPFTVLKEWIPSRSSVIDNAKNIGLTIEDTCALIAAEPLAASEIGHLPNDLNP